MQVLQKFFRVCLILFLHFEENKKPFFFQFDLDYFVTKKDTKNRVSMFLLGLFLITTKVLASRPQDFVGYCGFPGWELLSVPWFGHWELQLKVACFIVSSFFPWVFSQFERVSFLK